MDLKQEFGNAVKTRRTLLGLSQEALAERSDLHRTYITDIEHGTRNLTLLNISKLADGLGLSIGELFTQSDGTNGNAANLPSDFQQSAIMKHRLCDILILEDDPADIELTLMAFKQARLMNRIQVLRDGATALDFIFGPEKNHTRLQKSLPGAVLLNLNLPIVSGIEVLRRIKADSRTREIKVVVLTASAKHQDLQEAMRLGAAGCIVKPVDFNNFSSITPKLDLWWTLLRPNLDPALRATHRAI